VLCCSPGSWKRFCRPETQSASRRTAHRQSCRTAGVAMVRGLCLSFPDPRLHKSLASDQAPHVTPAGCLGNSGPRDIVGGGWWVVGGARAVGPWSQDSCIVQRRTLLFGVWFSRLDCMGCVVNCWIRVWCICTPSTAHKHCCCPSISCTTTALPCQCHSLQTRIWRLPLQCSPSQ
jgi:hypothetical protein